MERVATLIKNDLLDARVLLDHASDFIILNWEALEPLVLDHRRVTGSMGLWEIEFIARKARGARGQGGVSARTSCAKLNGFPIHCMATAGATVERTDLCAVSLHIKTIATIHSRALTLYVPFISSRSLYVSPEYLG
jgi:hypothetical protein